MPIVRVTRLVRDQSDTKISELKKEIIETIIKVENISLEDKTDILVSFPHECSAVFEGEQEEVIVEIFGLFNKQERTKEVVDKLAYNIGQLVEGYFPSARVQCMVEMIDPTKGFYVTPDNDEDDDEEDN